MKLKLALVVALCTLAIVECKPSEHRRIARQEPILLDVNGLPVGSTLDTVMNLDALGFVQQVGTGAAPGVLDVAKLPQLPTLQG